ncbi:hypothetical protein ABT248_31620 [Streptomyces sp. NPDC000971]|uniref:hypothetical protein n=1 Tax=Streptomyces TaxID=1883 RepID=UPI0004BE2908|nr:MULTISPECIES: hypothetical protein [Streptomyces]MDX3186606.1 hypothetical protein [Streptomyces sp. ME02-7008A-1]MDX3307372.1 hypothetical protein [Streptomyces sp. ME02-7008A]QBR04640.1 hypothetical protein D7Y56_01065 [Streptomyces sp. S501]WSZ45843.1 hypothetical protein OG337_00125 [[Kitasatospora] papulosa]
MPDQQPYQPKTDSEPSVHEALRDHTALRERTVDDHMFTAGEAWGIPSTFRLQLFTAPGHRPVAVVTQTPDEGTSLTNAAEHYASRVWELHAPDEPEPPIWIQHYVEPDDQQSNDAFDLVRLRVDGRFELSVAGWLQIAADQIATLVGTPVDGTRGERYVPHPAPPEQRLQYVVMDVADLPEPTPFREACMTPLRRILNRLLRRTSCCWYHQQDWSKVSELGIQLIEHARNDGKTDHEISEQFIAMARELGTSNKDLMALKSLLEPSVAIAPHLGENATYTNGNHRARAMKDADVTRTVVATWLPPHAG